jgi:sigma-B regulation protein RsbU (phosphoserine phosphatase)
MGGTTGKEILLAPLNLYDPVSGEPNYHNVATYAALHGESINIADVYHAEGFDFFATQTFDKKNNYRTISCLTIPLTDNVNNVIGVLQLLNAQDSHTGRVIPFDPYLQLVAESLASQAAVALNNNILLQRERELSKFERDMQIGRQMQADFLPAELPSLPNWEIAAFFEPAREVSGDFYDAFTLLNNTKIALVIADVCDKGVGAALFMTLIRSLIRAFSEQHYSLRVHDSLSDEQSAVALKSAVLATNDYIAINHARMNMFATLFFGVLDPKSGSLIYVNGGHEAPVLMGSNGVQARLGQTGPAVGIMPNVNFRVEQIDLNRGNTLFAYTDGVTEARALDNKFFSEQRLLSSLTSLDSVTAGDMLESIKARVHSYIGSAEQFDDITMLAIRRTQEQCHWD